MRGETPASKASRVDHSQRTSTLVAAPTSTDSGSKARPVSASQRTAFCAMNLRG